MSACIVGGGLVGVSTAVALQGLEPRAAVTLVADQASPNTVSDVSAGFWRPIYLPDPRTSLLRRWGEETFALMESLWKKDPLYYGANQNSGFEFYHEQEDDPFWRDLVHGYRKVGAAERRRYGYDDFKDGAFFTTYSVEPAKYIPVLEHEFRLGGGVVQKRRVGGLAELCAFAAVGNCAGMGAGALAGDASVFPVRGQVIRARAPHAKHFYVFGDDYYLLQNKDVVVMGGTHTKGDWETAVRPADTHFILNGLAKYLPWVKELEIVEIAAGLRPGRPEIRLEKELFPVGGGHLLPVVHNYGHGGSGISLHQGCAMDAARLLKEAIHRPSSKL